MQVNFDHTYLNLLLIAGSYTFSQGELALLTTGLLVLNFPGNKQAEGDAVNNCFWLFIMLVSYNHNLKNSKIKCIGKHAIHCQSLLFTPHVILNINYIILSEIFMHYVLYIFNSCYKWSDMGKINLSSEKDKVQVVFISVKWIVSFYFIQNIFYSDILRVNND